MNCVLNSVSFLNLIGFSGMLEAEAGGLQVLGQPGLHSKTLSQKTKTKQQQQKI
jgi:hypothetical protein